MARVAALAIVVVAVLAAGGCSRKKDAVHLAETGAETWVVDGAPYRISSTHYERGPSNVVVYVVSYPVPPGTSAANLDKDGAGILAWPIVKYAYNNRTFARAKIPPLSGSTPPSINLAIDIFSSDGSRFLFRHEVPAGK